MNLLIIHKDVPDIPFIVENILSEVRYIIVDLENDNLKNIVKQIQEVCKINKPENIGIIRHNINPVFIQKLSTQDICKVDPELDSWLKFSSFMFRLKKIGCNNVDLISCNCYTDDWKYIINYYKHKYGINIRSSVNITGAGGDWILESDNIDLVGLYFEENIINYSYSLKTASSLYDIGIVRVYDWFDGFRSRQYDALCGYGKNDYGKFGIGGNSKMDENFSEYTIIKSTLGLYQSDSSPLTTLSSSYMNTIFKLGRNFIGAGNKINYISQQYTFWNSYFEKDYPFKSQTNTKYGASRMTTSTVFTNVQELNDVLYFEIGISSTPDLILFANVFEDADLAAAALAKNFGFGWTIEKKYEEWYDWFEEPPLQGNLSYATQTLVEMGDVMSNPYFIAFSVLLTVAMFVVTAGGFTAVYASMTAAFAAVRSAVQAAMTTVVNVISALARSVVSAISSIFTSAAASTTAASTAVVTGTVTTSVTTSVTASLPSVAASVATAVSNGIKEASKFLLKQIADFIAKQVGVTLLYTTLSNAKMVVQFLILPTVVVAVDKAQQIYKRGIVNTVIEEAPTYITYPKKPFHKNVLLKPTNTYTQKPINDGYFIAYLTKNGDIWCCGDNTHGQIGPKIFNMQENYGAGKPQLHEHKLNPLKVALYTYVIGVVSYYLAMALSLFSFVYAAFLAVILGSVTAVYVRMLLSPGTAYLRPLGGGAYPILTKININQKFRHVTCGDGYLVALGYDNKLYASGKNLFYQMPGKLDYFSLFGLTKLPDIELFTKMNGEKSETSDTGDDPTVEIKHIVAGPNHLVIMTNLPGNDIYVTGDTTYGQGGLIDDKKYEVYLNHLIDKNTGNYGVPACIVGDQPMRLFIPNNETVLQVCCGLKCTVVLTELRNVYVYGFGYDLPRKVHLRGGGVSLTIFDGYIPSDISSVIDKKKTDINIAMDNILSDPSGINLESNLKLFSKVSDTTFTTINYASNVRSINRVYFDLSTNSIVNIKAIKNNKGEWDISYNPQLSHIYCDINETSTNVNSQRNIPKFIKIINDTIILYCTDVDDSIDNIVHVDATNKNINANEVKISTELKGYRIIPGTYYFGHNLTYMRSQNYKFGDLNTYYTDELNKILASSEFDTIQKYIDFGVDLLKIISYNKFTIDEFKDAGITFSQLYKVIFMANTSNVYSDKIIDASWTIQQYLDAGLTFKELWTNMKFRNANKRFTINDYIQTSIPIKEILQECHWLTCKDFFDNQRDLKEVYEAGFNVVELLEGGYSIYSLGHSGIPLYEIPKSLGIGLSDLVFSGYLLYDIVKSKHYSVSEMKNYDISLNNLYMFSIEQLRVAGYSANQIMLDLSFSNNFRPLENYIRSGFTAGELRQAGITIKQLSTFITNKTIKLVDIYNAGYPLNQLKPFNYSIIYLKNAGYTAKDMKDADYTVAQIRILNGYTDKALLEGGYSAIDLGLKRSTLRTIKVNNNDRMFPYKLLTNIG